jgi:hypothetical protein
VPITRACIEASIATRRAKTAAILAAGEKACPRCQQVLPLDAFYARPSARGTGTSWTCKSCEITAAMERSGRWRRVPLAEYGAAADELKVERSGRTRKQLQCHDRQQRTPRIPVLPSPPDWSAGLCTTSPDHHWWTSELPAEQHAAALACTSCPILRDCESWSLAVSDLYTQTTVYGAMTLADRRRRRQLLDEIAEQVRG